MRPIAWLLSLLLSACIVTVGEEDAGPKPLVTSGTVGSGTTGTTSGAATTTSGSTSGTTSGYCGDGIVQAGEVCDLGPLNGTGVGCNATCNLLGLVSTVAGGPDGGLQDGIGADALFYLPYGVAVLNGDVYVADTYFRAVRKVDPSTGSVVTIAGGSTSCIDQNGVSDAGTFCDINGLAAFNGGILATDDSCVRFVTPEGSVTTFAGQLALDGTPATGVDAGPFQSALYGVPQSIAVSGDLIFTDSKLDGFVLESNVATQEMTVLAEIGGTGALQLGGMTTLNGLVYVTDQNISGGLITVDAGGGFGPTSSVPINAPNGICNDGRSIYICVTGTNQIAQYDTVTGTFSLLAGGAGDFEQDGLGADAGFHSPASCAWDPGRGRLYVTDRFGYTLRMIR